MIRILFPCVLVIVLCFAASVEAAPTPSALDVRGLSVEFVDAGHVRVRGELRCTGLEIHGPAHDMFYSDVYVNVDLPHPKHGFTLLPEHFQGLPSEPEARSSWLHWGYRPRFWYEGRAYGLKEARFFQSSTILRPDVLDRGIDNEKDDGRWIPFDKTLTLQRPAGVAEYRVVVGWKLAHRHAGDFAHRYFWVVYGPFAWGEAPACKPKLRALYRRPASFTPEGVSVKEPKGKPPARRSEGAKETADAKRPKPKRPKERPSQLVAAEAAERLEKTLRDWPEITRLGARANPRVARVDIQLAPRTAAASLAGLVGGMAIEAAHEFTWVQSLEIALKGDHGTSTVTVSWDVAAAFAVGEIELADFAATWKTTGKAFELPEKGS